MAERRRQRSIMATDSEWNRVKEHAAAAGLSISQFLLQRSLEPPRDPAPDSTPDSLLMRRIAIDVAALAMVESWRMKPAGADAWQRILKEAEDRVDSERLLS